MNTPLPSWIVNPVDAEAAAEITMLVFPRIDFAFAEDRRELPAYIAEIIVAFQQAHFDTDWDAENYICAVESFTAGFLAANPRPFIRA